MREQDILLNIIGGGENRRASRTRAVSTSEDGDREQSENQNTTIQKFSSKAGDLAIMNKLGVINELHANQQDPRLKPKVIGCAELESELLNRNKSDDNIAEQSSKNVTKPSGENSIRLAKSSPNLRRHNLTLTNAATTVSNTSSNHNPLPTTPIFTGTQSRIAASVSMAGAASVPAQASVSLISPNVVSKSGGPGKGRDGLPSSVPNHQRRSLAGMLYLYSIKS